MFNGLAKLLSVGFIGKIDRHAERGSANVHIIAMC